MKTQFSKIGALSLAAILPLVDGCVAESSEVSSDATNNPVVANSPAPVVATNAAIPPVPDAAAVPPAKPEPAPAAAEQKTLPATLNPNSPAAEIAKLAQAGVEDAVLLSFVTNSSKVFNLTSDEIVYLNDLGVPGHVVTAIIDHDQGLKKFWASASAAPAPVAPAPTNEVPVDQTASAPSYVNPPPAQVIEQPTTVVDDNYFYSSLSPYGSWIEVEGYGRCWQPTVVVQNRNWQPYCDRGRWVYSDCGWYWLSDYSWGSTVFHYGRWFSHPRWGWCWWPDRVWGPSWVTWRYSNDYCGWAPLPPAAIYRPGFGFAYHGRSVGFGFDFGIGSACFTFVPTARFCDPRPWHHRVSGVNVSHVYNQTTIINNFGSGNHNTVINRGIDPDRIRSVSRTEIRQVKVQDTAQGPNRSGRNERLDRDGRTIVVNRPHFGNESNFNGKSPNRPVSPSVTVPPTGNKPTGPAPGREHRDEHRGTSPRSGFATENPTSPTVTPPKPTTGGNVTIPPKSVEPRASAAARYAERPQEHQRGGDVTLLPKDNPVTVPTPAPTTTPSQPATKPAPGSYVIIGNKDAKPVPVRPSSVPTYNRPKSEQIAEVNPASKAPPTATWTQPSRPPTFDRPVTETPRPPTLDRPVTETPRPPTFSRPVTESPRIPATVQQPQARPAPSRTEVRDQLQQQQFQQQKYSAPSAVQRFNTAPAPTPAPSYRPPAQSYSPPPAQSYTAPRYQQSSPSHSAPQAAPTPAPQQRSQPAPSPAPASRGDSGNSGNSGNRGHDRR